MSSVAQIACGIGGLAPQQAAESEIDGVPPAPAPESQEEGGPSPGDGQSDGGQALDAPPEEAGEEHRESADDGGAGEADDGETSDGESGGDGQSPEELGEGILDHQREEVFVRGDVDVVGDRFNVAGKVWYPKTDFLTAVAPGEDILDGNTHTYLGRGHQARRRLRQALVGHGYNSIYIYTLNQGDYGAGGRPGNVVTPYGDQGWSFDTAKLDEERVQEWRTALEELLAAGLKPFLWLAADDSPDIARGSLGQWREYVGHMVDAFDDLPVVWVVGLEVDEYWDADGVSARREAVQALTDRPVGVHLTTRETRRNRADFVEGFDFVMAQLESPRGDDAYRQDVRSLASRQVPWVASEFNVRGQGQEADVTARSKRIGRVIASVGDPPRVAGLGNGIDLAAPDESPDPDPDPDPDPGPEPAPPAINLDTVTWLHTNVTDWAVTANLRGVRVDDDQICLDYDKAGAWPVHDLDGTAVVANPWIFIQHDGRWWAATWEWMRPGQTCKSRRAVNGDHIKQDPFWEFSPQSGTTYGFMVSALARSGARTVLERSNIVMITWP